MCRAYGTPFLVEVTNNGLKSVVKICSEPMALVSTANLVLIPNSIKNNLKDVCIDKGPAGSGLSARSLGRRVAQNIDGANSIP